MSIAKNIPLTKDVSDYIKKLLFPSLDTRIGGRILKEISSTEKHGLVLRMNLMPDGHCVPDSDRQIEITVREIMKVNWVVQHDRDDEGTFVVEKNSDPEGIHAIIFVNSMPLEHRRKMAQDLADHLNVHGIPAKGN